MCGKFTAQATWRQIVETASHGMVAIWVKSRRGSRAEPWLTSLLYAAIVLVVTTGACRAGALIEIQRDGGSPLPAYIARPSGAGPFPAVVVLHQCSGISSLVTGWADRLARWGYVAVAPDSLTPRGRNSACAGSDLDQVHDAYRALEYLSVQPFVRADHIALMGISLGAGATLNALERDGIASKQDRRFRAGVAFYPPCAGASGIMTAPVLVLVGERDDWTPAEACRDMAAGRSAVGISRRPGDRSMVELVVYPDTHHSFLNPDIPSGTPYLGHWLQYNEASTQDATVRVQRFFERWLKQ